MKKTIAVVAGALLLQSVAFAAEQKPAAGEQGGVWTEGEGEIPLTNLAAGADANASDEAKDAFRRKVATEKAKEVAMRDCVQKVVGTYVSSFTATDNFQILQDMVATTVTGHVSKSEVVSAEETPDYTWKVKLKCLVNKGQIDADAANTALILGLKKQRRVFVSINEEALLQIGDKGGNKDTIKLSKGTFNIALREALRKDGFTILDPNMVDGKLKQKAAIQKLDSATDAAELAHALEADVIFYGNVTGVPVPKDDPKAISAAVDNMYIDAEVYITSPDSSNSFGEYKGREKGSSTTSMDDARAQGSSKAAEAAVKSLRGKLYNYWNQELLNGQRVAVTLTGVKDYSALNIIKNTLTSQVAKVKSISSVKFEKGVARMEIAFQGSADDLAGAISDQAIPRVGKVSVQKVTNNTVEAALVK